MALFSIKEDDRKKLERTVLNSALALHSLYETVESISHGADRALLKSQKMALERIIEKHIMYFNAGKETTQ